MIIMGLLLLSMIHYLELVGTEHLKTLLVEMMAIQRDHLIEDMSLDLAIDGRPPILGLLLETALLLLTV
jgi:hypothetical protein